MEALVALVKELTDQGYSAQVKDINVADESNLIMTTQDDYTVRLGDAENLRAKIGTVRAVIEELKRRSLTGGILEASIPGEATYRAPEGAI